MKIFPAIDLYDGKAVRLFKGDYAQMTVYSTNPPEIAEDFKASGAEYMHVVDLEGARDGNTPNFEVVKRLAKVGLFTEIGGGVRSEDVVKKYLDVGVKRVILGTAAVTDKPLLARLVERYGEAIAVGVDVKDGFVAIKGWTENSERRAVEFCKELYGMGVKTVICTDVGRDGAMQGTNFDLYGEIGKAVRLNVIASGGVSSMDDVVRLNEAGVYGAIIGKAYYTKAISLKEAIEVTK